LFFYCLYRHRVKNRSHFMSLFKRVFYSRITDLANKRSRINEAGLGEIAVSQVAVKGYEDSVLEMLGGAVDSEAELSCLISQSSREVRMLLDAFAGGYMTAPRLSSKPTTPQRSANGHFVKKTIRRETNNEFYNRVLGTAGINYEAELRAIFDIPKYHVAV